MFNLVRCAGVPFAMSMAPLSRKQSVAQPGHSSPPQGDVSGDVVRQAAQAGLETPAGKLPYADQIQRLFGRHKISSIQAHTGPEAGASAVAMSATAYATGDHVVFAGTPTLHTAAHEAAHVVQQQGGIQLLGGIGKVGDVYEQNADAVAAKVTAGQSAEGLLDQYAEGRPGITGQTQRLNFSVRRLIQRQFKEKEYVQVNDDPPWYGRVTQVLSKDTYQIEVGGTDTKREVPAKKVERHPAFAAKDMNIPAIVKEGSPKRSSEDQARKPDLANGTRVHITDSPLKYGTIVDWDGKGKYKVKLLGEETLEVVEQSKVVPVSAIAKGYVKVNDGVPWYGKVTGEDSGAYKVRVGGTKDMETTVDARKVEPLLFPIVRLTNATYIPFAEIPNQMNKDETVVMRAQNTGDMYHIKASLVINPTFKLLIWNVNATTKGQAQQVVDLVTDLASRGLHVFYTTENRIPKGFYRTETKTTEDIEGYLNQGPIDVAAAHEGLKKSKDALIDARRRNAKDLLKWADEYHRKLRIKDLADKYAPYTEEEGHAFRDDLESGSKGKFKRGPRYVIVNFRDTGHSPRPGANAPALDTGIIGVRQIIDQVHDVLGKDVVIVPMGEQPEEMNNGPNLLNYWKWPSARGRREQTAILKYVKDHYDIVGAIGMRSGVMDQLAFCGIKIISIDISPHRFTEKGLPDQRASKGWDRGLKLENVYKEAYGRVFIKEYRKDEKTRRLPNWTGEFARPDIESIRDSIDFYFGDSQEGTFRHSTHPSLGREKNEGLKRLKGLHRASAYELVDQLHPYLSRAQSAGKGKKVAEFVAKQIKEIEKDVHGKIQIEFGVDVKKSIEWMQQHEFLRKGDGRVARDFGLPQELALKVYSRYDELYATPQKLELPI